MISPVRSVDPSFTMTHSTGRIVCDNNDSNVLAIWADSSRTGLMIA
jgi:hypothetical protein